MRNRRTWVLAGIVAAAGIVQLAVSSQMNGWWSSVLVNTGTATLLFLPFFVLGRSLERQIVSVRDESQTKTTALSAELSEVREESRRTIDELRELVRADIETSEEADRQLFRSLGETPTRTGLLAALNRAAGLGLLSVYGPRVQSVHESVDIYARFNVGSTLTVQIEGVDGDPITTLDWPESDGIDAFCRQLGQELHRRGLRPTSVNYDPLLMFAQLSELMSRAFELDRRRALVDPVRGVEQLVKPQWFITDQGLTTAELGQAPYRIVQSQLDESDWVQHMRGKTWVDVDSFIEAFETARRLRAARPRPLDGAGSTAQDA